MIRRQLALIVALTLLAAGLRIYHLSRSPLDGDEAFAVRYWAASPTETLTTLAAQEPHPIGTFLLFWAWKSLVGGSEFAMRSLSMLINLFGVAAMFALAWHLFQDIRLASVGALLWAIDPFQIAHAQDARNYAIWASLSVLTLWLLVRAVDTNRRRDWALYAIAVTGGLYIFFAEVSVVAVHFFYLLIFRRRALRGWVITMLVVGIALIPWAAQAWTVAHTYHGTGTAADLAIVPTFWLDLLFGENRPVVAGLGLLVANGIAVLGLATVIRRNRRAGLLCALLIAIPLLLLLAAATRSNVLWIRYLIGTTPALLLIAAGMIVYTPGRIPRTTLALGLLAMMGASLYVYYFQFQRASDWYGLRDYLDTSVGQGDVVIMTSTDPTTGYADPAFAYYYPGETITLPHPGYDTAAVVRDALATHLAVWFVPVGDQGGPIDKALRENGQLISDEGSGRSFLVRQYRAREVRPGEIQHPMILSAGGGVLIGYSLTGAAITGRTLTVLLYWREPPAANLTTFVHLIDSPKADGSPLWAQEDHPPQPGRDVYHLNLSGVVPGTYTIEIGLYDAPTQQRIVLSAGGDSYNLTQIVVQPMR